MPLDGLHNESDRAVSFGSRAESYDRYRPGYPSVFIDDLVTRRPANALDIGCGTGKVAVALMERGLSVIGIDPDDGMIAVARRHRVRVEVGSFESWDDQGRTFDLITAGHSWHWVDPVRGLAKATSILNPGGTVALFWNYHVVKESLLAAFDEAYRAFAPELTVVGRDPSSLEDRDPFLLSEGLISLGSRTYRWDRLQTAKEWTSMVATFSDHANLGQERLRELQRALHRAIEQSDGEVRSTCGTYVWMARKQTRIAG